jgi:hypothetical protein
MVNFSLACNKQLLVYAPIRNRIKYFSLQQRESKSEIVITICPCGKMNNSFFLETNKPDLAQKVY